MSEGVGVYPAVLTATYEDGSVDYEKTGEHWRSILSGSVKGITILGSAGEGGEIPLDEAKKLMSLGRRLCAEQGKELVVGTGRESVDEAIKLTEYASSKEIAADAVLVRPPILGLSDLANGWLKIDPVVEVELDETKKQWRNVLESGQKKLNIVVNTDEQGIVHWRTSLKLMDLGRKLCDEYGCELKVGLDACHKQLMHLQGYAIEGVQAEAVEVRPRFLENAEENLWNKPVVLGVRQEAKHTPDSRPFQERMAEQYYYRLLNTIPTGSDTTLYLYNIPSVTGITIQPWIIGKLISHELSNTEVGIGKVAGLKNTSPEVSSTREYSSQYPGLDIIVGWDAALTETILLPGHGEKGRRPIEHQISAPYVVFPEMASELQKKAFRLREDPGNEQLRIEVMSTQSRINTYMNVVGDRLLQFLKEVLNMGPLIGDVRRGRKTDVEALKMMGECIASESPVLAAEIAKQAHPESVVGGVLKKSSGL